MVEGGEDQVLLERKTRSEPAIIFPQIYSEPNNNEMLVAELRRIVGDRMSDAKKSSFLRSFRLLMSRACLGCGKHKAIKIYLHDAPIRNRCHNIRSYLSEATYHPVIVWTCKHCVDNPLSLGGIQLRTHLGKLESYGFTSITLRAPNGKCTRTCSTSEFLRFEHEHGHGAHMLSELLKCGRQGRRH
jgi:hypothetical protein